MNYLNKFVKVLSGKHQGKYAYCESINDWRGGSLVIVSGDNDGRFECLVFPQEVEILSEDADIEKAKKCACTFYDADIREKSDYVSHCEDKNEVEYVLGMIFFRAEIYNDLLTR